MLRRWWPVLPAAVLALALAMPAHASLLRGLTVGQLRSASDLIVAGRVLSTETLRTGRSIETRTRVAVTRSFKGRAATVTVVTPGGRIDGRRLLVAGVPAFEPGEEVLLFLYRAAGAWRPVGLFQGVWRIDPERPEVVRASAATGATLLAPDRGEAAVRQPERRLDGLVGRSR